MRLKILPDAWLPHMTTEELIERGNMLSDASNILLSAAKQLRTAVELLGSPTLEDENTLSAIEKEMAEIVKLATATRDEMKSRTSS